MTGPPPPHALRPGSLPGLDLPLVGGGLVVGREAGGAPLTVRLFRAFPVRVGVFGAGRLVVLLAFRALGQGAQVVVVTDRPAGWAPLARAAPPGPSWVTVVPPGSPTPTAGAMLRPCLVVDDTGGGQAGPRHDLGGWQAAVSVEPAMTPDTAGAALRWCDLVVAGRTEPAALRPLRDAFGLPDDQVRWLPQMPDDVVAVAVPGRCRFVRVVPSQAEQAAFGPVTPGVA